jgi:hypothetical protein
MGHLRVGNKKGSIIVYRIYQGRKINRIRFTQTVSAGRYSMSTANIKGNWTRFRKEGSLDELLNSLSLELRFMLL